MYNDKVYNNNNNYDSLCWFGFQTSAGGAV